MGGLVCFQKDKTLPAVDAVPGCLGDSVSRTDWCTTTKAIQDAISAAPSSAPSSLPTMTPSDDPTEQPSSAPSDSSLPSTEPSSHISERPSAAPTSPPLFHPSDRPSARPLQSCGISNSSACCGITIFYAIADVPYTEEEADELPHQIQSLPDNAEFVVHLGDIRSARNMDRCNLAEYQAVASTLKKSKVPVFIVVGDNEWNDCSNIDEAWGYWEQEFSNFEDHWNHDFVVHRPPERPESFAFAHKKTLYIGLNIVGGRIHDATEWSERLSEQATWTITLMRAYTAGGIKVRSVVIFAHANPNGNHDEFFVPVKEFVQNHLESIPVLYMNGDAHRWSHEPKFMNVDQMLRIQLVGGTREPPLEIIVATHEDTSDKDAEEVFLYDRKLSP